MRMLAHTRLRHEAARHDADRVSVAMCPCRHWAGRQHAGAAARGALHCAVQLAFDFGANARMLLVTNWRKHVGGSIG